MDALGLRFFTYHADIKACDGEKDRKVETSGSKMPLIGLEYDWTVPSSSALERLMPKTFFATYAMKCACKNFFLKGRQFFICNLDLYGIT